MGKEEGREAGLCWKYGEKRSRKVRKKREK